MKQIIALQEYSDKHVSLYEGQIRNLSNEIADRLIAQGIVAEHSDSSPSSGGGVLKVNILVEELENQGSDLKKYKLTLDKKYSQIYDYKLNKGPVIMMFNSTVNFSLKGLFPVDFIGTMKNIDKDVFIVISYVFMTAMQSASSEVPFFVTDSTDGYPITVMTETKIT